MKTPSSRDPSTELERAWEALGTVERHPQVTQWLAEADGLAAKRISHRVAIRRWALSAAAGIASLVIAFGAYQHLAPKNYQTDLGEQRDVILPDGSRMTLNTDTAVAVRYTKERRYIQLRRGEALFSVKRNPNRPFDVEARGTVTRAIGTEFNVDIRAAKVTVSVLEGAVSVVPAANEKSDDAGRTTADSPVLPVKALAKGQAVEFRALDGKMQEHRADLRRINAWRTRRLEFTNTPLAEAVEEFNRYSATRVVIGSPDVVSVRVNGMFRIGDEEAFLYSLREALGLETHHQSSNEVIVMRPGSQVL